MEENLSKSWFVYLVLCKDGSLYTGSTNDLDARMLAHASGKGSKYVYSKGFSFLLASKDCGSRSEACKAESFVKSLHKSEKLDFFG